VQLQLREIAAEGDHGAHRAALGRALTCAAFTVVPRVV
jgi:hypothetical protein